MGHLNYFKGCYWRNLINLKTWVKDKQCVARNLWVTTLDKLFHLYSFIQICSSRSWLKEADPVS